MGFGSNSAIDSGMVAQLQWAIVAALRGDETTSRVEQKGSAMRS